MQFLEQMKKMKVTTREGKEVDEQPEEDQMNLRIFQTHISKAQPFKVKFAGQEEQKEKLIDAGGGYRTVMNDIVEELIETG